MGLDLASIVGSNVGQAVKDIVGTFKLSPEAKLEFDRELEANKTEVAKIQADLEARLTEAAAANIQAETKSNDKYTSRARPTFLYIVELILGWNYVVVPIFGRMPIELPGDLLTLFGFVMMGYIGGRSWEKIALGGK